MAERETEGERKRGVGGWRVRAAAALSAGAVLILGGWLLCGWWYRASAWEQLVAINRAHLLDPGENVATVYDRLLADRRGTWLLVALRRHKNMTGAWPRRLDDIRAHVPQEAWSDPYAGGRPFLYQTAGESFLLYCRGPDRRDQGGQGDDWQIWPPRRITSLQPSDQEAQ